MFTSLFAYLRTFGLLVQLYIIRSRAVLKVFFILAIFLFFPLSTDEQSISFKMRFRERFFVRIFSNRFAKLWLRVCVCVWVHVSQGTILESMLSVTGSPLGFKGKATRGGRHNRERARFGIWFLCSAFCWHLFKINFRGEEGSLASLVEFNLKGERETLFVQLSIVCTGCQFSYFRTQLLIVSLIDNMLHEKTRLRCKNLGCGVRKVAADDFGQLIRG